MCMCLYLCVCVCIRSKFGRRLLGPPSWDKFSAAFSIHVFNTFGVLARNSKELDHVSVLTLLLLVMIFVKEVERYWSIHC